MACSHISEGSCEEGANSRPAPSVSPARLQLSLQVLLMESQMVLFNSAYRCSSFFLFCRMLSG